MIVRDGLHRLFDELVALILEALPVSVFPGVDTATVVVVLGRRRWRSDGFLVRLEVIRKDE